MPATSREIEAPTDLLARLEHARRTTDALFGIVRNDSLYERPIPERHRIVFYIGHLEAFDRNLLNGRLLALPDSSPEFDRLFAFGIDPVGGGLPTDQPSDWPELHQVRDYVRRVRNEIDDALARLSSDNGEFPERLLLNVAIEHRLMHAETLAYMLHRLPYDRKIEPAGAPQAVASAVDSTQIEIPSGSATLGLIRGGDDFGWDNEYERQVVEVPAFLFDR
jgi:iron(II)-dependent oxidoreductase